MWLCNPVRSCIYRLYEIPSVHWKRCPVFFSCKFFLFPWILTSCPGHVFSMSAVSLDTSWPWHRFSLGISFSGHCPFLQISFSQHRFLPKSIPLDISSSSSLSRDTIFLDIRFFYIFSWNFLSLTSLDVAIPLHCNIFLLAPLSFLTLLSLVTLSLVIWGIMFFS